MTILVKIQGLILDPGTYEMQIGIAGADEPMITVPSIYTDSVEGLDTNMVVAGLTEMAKERFYGSRALNFRNVLKMHYFFQEKDFISFGQMVKELLEANYWDPQDLDIIIIDSPRITGQFKHGLQTVLFHTLKFPRIAYIPANQCVLSALGKETGVVVDIGHFSTTFDGVFKGFPNLEAQFEMPIGSYHITQRIIDLLFARLQFDVTGPLYWIAEDIKHATAFTSIDPKKELVQVKQGKTDYDQIVELPNGQSFKINWERFNCVEPLFEPELVHVRSENIIEFIDRSIRTWERHQVPELVQNIILVGQGSKITGLVERIEQDLKERFPKTLNVKVLTPPEVKKIFWIGASIIYLKRNGQFEWLTNPESLQNPNKSKGVTNE